jgi:hypothetical protein
MGVKKTGVWGVSMVRDEGDVIFHTLCHLAGENLDGIIIADNLSTDNTRAEIERARTELAEGSPWERACEIIVVEDNVPGYYQSAKMTALAAQAATEHGAQWIVPFDADELWYTTGDRLGIVLHQMGGYVAAVRAPLYNHFPSSIDPAGSNPFETIQWRQREPGALPKVAFRWHPSVTILQGNHAISGGAEHVTHVTTGAVALRHFPYRTFDQFKHKAQMGAAAYAATDLPMTEGAHWRQYGAILERHGESALREVFERWFWFLAPVEGGLVLDPAPFRRWDERV